MELRGRSHWHFIQAIKGGKVTKLLNVNTKGQPEIKFKIVRDLYDTKDLEVQTPVPIIHLRDDLEASPSKFHEVKVESLDQLEASGFAYHIDDEEKDADQDDPSFVSITLKEFMKRCKTKKRKTSTSANKCEGSSETCSSVEQFQEDDCDLEVPLCSWKTKLSKKKGTKKRSVKCVSNLQNPLSIVKYEQKDDDQNSCQANDNWLVPIDIKVEACEVDYSDYQDMSCAAPDRHFNRSDHVDSSPFTYNEVPIAVDSPASEMGVSFYPTKEPLLCSVSTESYEYMEDINPKFDKGFPCWDVVKVDSPGAIDVRSEDSIEFNKEGYAILPLSDDFSSSSMSPVMDQEPDMHHISLTSSSRHNQQACSGAQAGVPEMTNSLLYLTETCGTCVDETPLEYRNSLDHGFDAGASTWEIVKVDEPGTGGSQCLDLSYYNEGGSIKCQIPGAVTLESNSPTLNHNPYMGDCLESNSSEHKISMDTTHDRQVEVPAMALENSSESFEQTVHANTYSADDKSDDFCMEDRSENKISEMRILQCPDPHGLQYINLAGTDSWIKACDMAINNDCQFLEYSDQGTTCSIEDSKNGHFSELEYSSVHPSSNCFTSCNSKSCSSPRKSSVSEENTCTPVRSDDVEKSCDIAARPHDTTDKPVPSSKLGDPIYSKLHHPPERLFSNRKVISPASQRKLWQAMEFTELDENDQPVCKEKFYLGIHSNHRILRAEGMDHLKIGGSTMNTKQNLRKPKPDQTWTLAESVQKFSHHASPVSHAGAGCHSIQTCSQSAITFSQQQMEDIQSVASKLTRELKSMTEVVREIWAASTTSSFKQQYVNQVRTVIENATRVEETSKQRLMYMRRKCTRFCRVMKLAEDGSAASENAGNVNSKKRKITFADESGGKLCQVKVIKDHIASLETGSVNQESLADEYS